MKGDGGIVGRHEDVRLNRIKILELSKILKEAGIVPGEQVADSSEILDVSDFETSAELDGRDSDNRARSNHTGTQLALTISDFQTEVSANTDLLNKVSKTGNEAVAGLKTFTDNLTLSADLTHTGNTLHSGTTSSILNSGGQFQIISSDFSTALLQATDIDTFIKDLRVYGFTFNQGSGTIYNDDTTDLTASASATELASAAAIKTYVDDSVNDFETTAQLNTRDFNNRNRSNHTGEQLASTIYDFETKVLEYEHTGFKKGGNALATLVDDTTYFLNGAETTLTLPVINSGGERVQLVSNTTTPVRVYPQTGDSLAGVVNGNYNIVKEGDVVIFYSDGNDNWYVKNIGKEVVTGWASYGDSTYTSGSPLTIASGITTSLSNDATSGLSSQLPSDASAFWDSTTNKLVGINEGDKYDIEVRFKAKSSSDSDNFTLNINIGGTIGVLNKKTCIFVKAANTEQDFAETLHYYTGSTFLANGGSIEVTAGTGELSIYDISFLITRTHKGI